MWGQCIEGFCHSIFLLSARLWLRALNHVYSGAGSKRGQQHNWMGRLAAALLWGKHHHTPRNQNKDTEGGKESRRGIRKLLFFPPLFYFAAMRLAENIPSTQQVCYWKRFPIGSFSEWASGSLQRRSKIFCVGSKILLQAMKRCVYRSFHSQRGPFS